MKLSLLLCVATTALADWTVVDNWNAIPDSSSSSESKRDNVAACEAKAVEKKCVQFAYDTKTQHCYYSKSTTFSGAASDHVTSGCVAGTVNGCKGTPSKPTPSPAKPTPKPSKPTPSPGPDPGGCGPDDHPSDCYALKEFAKATNFEKWTKNTHWFTPGKVTSVCDDWHGVTCDGGRVTGLRLKNNNLDGSIPDAIRNLTELRNLSLQGSRPADYHGCSGNNFHNASIPDGLYDLTKLEFLDIEYTCTGGKLSPKIGQLVAMKTLELHGNYIGGSIPQEIEGMKDIETFKLGRNPFTGTLPLVKTMSKVIQFNCNFCSLTGRFPDTLFDFMPSLQITYWDGNGFSGPLPSSIARAKKVTRLSFNINNFSGPIPAGICDIPAGNGGDTPDVGHDCRIGADTDLEAYQATYPWIQKVPGNNFDCPVPKCAVIGSCNKTKGTKVINPLSPVRCHSP